MVTLAPEPSINTSKFPLVRDVAPTVSVHVELATVMQSVPDVVGDRSAWTKVKLGVARTVKLTPLLATPPTVTTTFPVVAPAGTGATMLVALQLVGVAAVPLN